MSPSLYEYKGYEYRPEVDTEDDCTKIFHFIFKDGVQVKAPAQFYNNSPYSWATLTCFKWTVDQMAGQM